MPVDRYKPESIRRVIKGQTSIKTKTKTGTTKVKAGDKLFEKKIEENRKKICKFNQIKFDELKEVFLIKLSKTLCNKIFSNPIIKCETLGKIILPQKTIKNEDMINISDLDNLMNKANDILMSSSIIIKSNSMYIINYPFGKQYNVVSYPNSMANIDYICNCGNKSGCEHILAITLIPISSFLTTYMANNKYPSIQSLKSQQDSTDLSSDYIVKQLSHLTI
jgi:hypothetical protein